MNAPRVTGAELRSALARGGGVLPALPAIVYRDTYSGRGVIADNTSWDSRAADDRGYLPVEWWIMSLVAAENNEPREGEGITRLLVGGRGVPLPEVHRAAPELFGEAYRRWPLIKLLDIGGEPVTPDFSSGPEVPPIPVHVHGGSVRAGRLVGPGKHEAYFFPPLDVRGIDLRDAAVTRLGIRPEVSRDRFREAVEGFGRSDRAFSLLNEFPVEPYGGWDIRAGIVHAPGPWPTVEVQTPQDDYNLLSWQLGRRLDSGERKRAFERFVLRGLSSVDELLDRVVDWEGSTAADFAARAARPARLIEEAGWGRRYRTFSGRFSGELLAIEPARTLELSASGEPFALAVWAGEGRVGAIEARGGIGPGAEFLVAPGHAVRIETGAASPLWLLSFSPMRDAAG